MRQGRIGILAALAFIGLAAGCGDMTGPFAFDGTSAGYDPNATRRYYLSGNVHLTGTGIPGASVTASYDGWTGTTMTDASGSFELGSLEGWVRMDSVEVRVAAPGYRPVWGHVADFQHETTVTSNWGLVITRVELRIKLKPEA